VDPGLYVRTLGALLGDDRFGSILLVIIQTDAGTCAIKLPPIVAAIRDLQPDKPVLFAGLDQGAVVPDRYIAELRALGIAYFPSSERALRAMTRIEANMAQWPPAPPGEALAVTGLPAQGGVVPEYRAKAVLAQAGVTFPPSRIATTLAEAQAAAAGLGFPVVLKAQSAELSHKSDAGGVIVGLADAAALANGWARLATNIAQHRPGLVLDGVLVEAMCARGLELIVGAKHDPDWGPVILVGFGGVQAEIVQDVRLLTPDLPHAAIVAELGQLKSAPLLHGYRGAPALDVDAVADLVLALGRVLRGAPSITEIDLNPVVVYPNGQGIVALDALIACKPA
jgi:acyl-CoA synthetase (NDP forming)